TGLHVLELLRTHPGGHAGSDLPIECRRRPATSVPGEGLRDLVHQRIGGPAGNRDANTHTDIACADGNADAYPDITSSDGNADAYAHIARTDRDADAYSHLALRDRDPDAHADATGTDGDRTRPGNAGWPLECLRSAGNRHARRVHGAAVG